MVAFSDSKDQRPRKPRRRHGAIQRQIAFYMHNILIYHWGRSLVRRSTTALAVIVLFGASARAEDADTLKHLAKERVVSGAIASFMVSEDERTIHIMLTPSRSLLSEADELNRMGAVGRSFCLEATAPFSWGAVWTARVMSPDLNSPVFVCEFPADRTQLRP